MNLNVKYLFGGVLVLCSLCSCGPQGTPQEQAKAHTQAEPERSSDEPSKPKGAIASEMPAEKPAEKPPEKPAEKPPEAPQQGSIEARLEQAVADVGEMAAKALAIENIVEDVKVKAIAEAKKKEKTSPSSSVKLHASVLWLQVDNIAMQGLLALETIDNAIAIVKKARQSKDLTLALKTVEEVKKELGEIEVVQKRIEGFAQDISKLN